MIKTILLTTLIASSSQHKFNTYETHIQHCEPCRIYNIEPIQETFRSEEKYNYFINHFEEDVSDKIDSCIDEKVKMLSMNHDDISLNVLETDDLFNPKLFPQLCYIELHNDLMDKINE